MVDCDVHPSYPGPSDLRPYLPERWQEVLETSGFRGSAGYANAYPAGAATSGKAPADVAGARAALTETVFDANGSDRVILNCYYGVEFLRHPDWSAALMRAVNDWLADQWLARDPRMRASIVVHPRDPEGAAAEITRMVETNGFVQVLLPVRAERPYGQRFYDPIFETAVQHDLPIGIHFGGYTGNAPTASGWTTYYYEEYAGMPTAFQWQLTSLITEGTFERFPELRVVLLESGWTWLPSLMWRLDKEWRGLRRETPWVKRSPTEYIREHVRVSLQPVDAPLDGDLLSEILGQIGCDELLVYSSDYPHDHGISSAEVLALLPHDVVNRIVDENPRRIYGLDREATQVTA